MTIPVDLNVTPGPDSSAVVDIADPSRSSPIEAAGPGIGDAVQSPFSASDERAYSDGDEPPLFGAYLSPPSYDVDSVAPDCEDDGKSVY